jgi:carbamoyl-phosphate synthase large subunit
MVIGSGSIVVGQACDFDYSGTQACHVLREEGYKVILVNSNPATIMTDPATADVTYVEPLDAEVLIDILEKERPDALLTTLGGQTALNLTMELVRRGVTERLGVEVIGVKLEAITTAKDREQWSAICASQGLRQPPGDAALSLTEAKAIVKEIGYPVLVRPSYDLDGRAMKVVYDDETLERVMKDLTRQHGSLAREGGVSQSQPILFDSFLEDAIEVDVDAVRDVSGELFVAGIMEHVEGAGVDSGDSACVLPPQTLSANVLDELAEHTRKIATSLGVVGLINVHYAVMGEEVYVLEVNPRASRTVPFVAKATGVALAQVAVRVTMGQNLAELRALGLVPASTPVPAYVSVKVTVLPCSPFPDVDTVLGPAMRSTGEVMGIGESFGIAFAKAQLAAGARLPDSGQVFMSLADRDKVGGLVLARQLVDLGFSIAATVGTAGYLRSNEVPVRTLVGKIGQAELGADAVSMVSSGQVQLVVNTPSGGGARADGAAIRAACVAHAVPCLTTLNAGFAAAEGVTDTRRGWRVHSLQELHT